jgi:cytochrome c-type biogenesis protein CcmH
MSVLRAAWLLLGLVVAGAVVVAATQGGDATPKERVDALAREIQCPECDGVSVAQSPAQTSRAIRADLRDRVENGQSDDEIRDAYVDRYGESILLDPEGSGLGVLVWGLPIALLIAGGAGLVLATRHWRQEPRLHATAADEQLVEKARGE